MGDTIVISPPSIGFECLSFVFKQFGISCYLALAVLNGLLAKAA